MNDAPWEPIEDGGDPMSWVWWRRAGTKGVWRIRQNGPACWNSSRRSSSVAWKERLTTKSFAGIEDPPAAIRTE